MIKVALFFLAVAVALIPYAEPTLCSICEQVVYTNETTTPITLTFERGSHEGLVVVSPGQTVTIDVIWCQP